MATLAMAFDIFARDHASATFSKVGASATAASAQVKRASAEMSAAADAEANAAGRVRVAQLKLDEARAGGKASATQMARAEEQLAATQRAHVRTQAESTASAERYAAAQRGAGDAARAARPKIDGLMKVFAAVALVDAGKKMVEMAGHFQQSTNVLVTAAGETTKNLRGIRDGILNLAASTGTPLHELTDGMYVIEKAGIRGADGLKVLKAAAQGAREEGASLESVTQAMTSVMASYHLPASKAVMVMNQMKTASGESKTTMEEFSASLSTVLPLASANHISFAKVAGALATLTQHGTTAHEATQELAFSIRGLSAPNMVAIKEMGQLGISSQDVSQKLGQRGIAGTMNYLSETILRKMGPSGKVLLDTFLKSQSAGADVTQMMQAMEPATRKLAEQYVKGSIEAGSWSKQLNNLSPQQKSLASQFATAENKARGFNTAIRAGMPGSQTYTEALKKMTGGSTALNTALQLTGESTAGTSERIKKIADAAKNAGTDVQGWASTQKLFSVQMDMLKEQLQVIGIRIGTALIPMVRAAADGFSKLLTFVEATRKVTVPLVVALVSGAAAVWGINKAVEAYEATTRAAALMTGGLGKAMDNVKLRTMLASDAFKTARTESGRLGSSWTALKAGAEGASGAIKAFRGIAGIAGLALLATDTSHASTSINTLKDAAAGAAIGFSVAGPWGAAIGGAVGLLGGLFGASQKAKKAQADLAAQAKSTAASVAATLDQQTGAITRNTTQTAKNVLATTGVYDSAKTLGVSLKDVTDAYLGNADAADRVGKRILAVRDAQGGEVNMSAKSKAAWDKINAAVFAAGGSFASTREHIREVASVTDTTVVPTDKLKIAQDNLKTATQDLNTQIQNEINKFTILRGDHASQSAANDTYMTSVDSLTSSLKTNGKQIGGNTTAALTNRQAIRDAAQALNDKVTADFKAHNSTMSYTKAMGLARTETEKGRQKLIDNITAVTGNRDAAKKYVDYLIQNPAHLKTDTPGMKEAQDAVKTLKADIQQLKGLNVSPEIAVKFGKDAAGRARSAAAHAASVHAQLPGHATGGPIFGAGTGTSDSIPALLSNNEHVWTAREVMAAGGHAAVKAIRSAVLKGRGVARATGGPVIQVHGSATGLSGTESGISTYLLRAANAAQKAADAAMAASFGGAFTGSTSGGVARWAGLIARVLRELGGPANAVRGVENLMAHESGGNPRAINLTDSNARAGHPSKGLMQTIQGTFDAYAGPYRARGIYDPLANIYAGINYAHRNYGWGMLVAGGRRDSSGHYIGYDSGGVARGKGVMVKNTIAPERVLSPAQTKSFERLVASLDHGNAGSMTSVIKRLTDVIREGFHGVHERQMLGHLRGLTDLQTRRSNVNDRLAAVRAGRANTVTSRTAIRDAFTGFGPNLADYAQSPTGILGGLRAQLSSVRKFTSSIRQLRKLGYPNSIVSQVVGLGLTDGVAAAAQLIGLSKADRRNVISTFGALGSAATGGGVSLSNQMYGGAIKAADAQIKRLQSRQKHIDEVFEHAADAFARRIAARLHVPIKTTSKTLKATHDAGGWLGTGVSLVANYTGKPEAVYTARQQAQMDEDRAMMRKLIARYESGQAGRSGPFIQNAVIRETVDLERYERQRAFRERSGNVSG